jgi:hypothetical protein
MTIAAAKNFVRLSMMKSIENKVMRIVVRHGTQRQR